MDTHELLRASTRVDEGASEARDDRCIGHTRASNGTDHVGILGLEHRGEARRESLDEPFVDLIGFGDAVVRTGVRVVVDLHVERALRGGPAVERHPGEGPPRAHDLLGRGRHPERAAHVAQEVAAHFEAVGRSNGIHVDLAVAVPVAEQHRGRPRARGTRGQRCPAREPVGRPERAA